jgi:hypothetical protein
VCDKVKVDDSTKPPTTTCDNSLMVVQDVGATFGGGGLFTENDTAKMNLDHWSGSGLWKKVGKGGSNCPPRDLLKIPAWVVGYPSIHRLWKSGALLGS